MTEPSSAYSFLEALAGSSKRILIIILLCTATATVLVRYVEPVFAGHQGSTGQEPSSRGGLAEPLRQLVTQAKAGARDGLSPAQNLSGLRRTWTSLGNTGDVSDDDLQFLSTVCPPK
jgi:hypothetical protein